MARMNVRMMWKAKLEGRAVPSAAGPAASGAGFSLSRPAYIGQILGAARGAAVSAVAIEGLEIFEYPPLRVKQAVVGVGRASKEQVARTVMAHFGHLTSMDFDEADAAAVALCHAFTGRF